jgi:hypothetical protein
LVSVLMERRGRGSDGRRSAALMTNEKDCHAKATRKQPANQLFSGALLLGAMLGLPSVRASLGSTRLARRFSRWIAS